MRYGRLLHQDYLKSFEWLSKATNQGYTDAQNALGGIYANGHGCDKDYVKANY
ncbi:MULTISPECIES: SEL1-like repeat protein [unclassified Acinetobacter]|uniref:SEL1-like repeat protein n=1 Tax=unclassified Acinetobacter TaxID=196816 RepID=UPI0015D3E368